MTERPNIIWILTDSVRTYPTDADDRGKLPMMDRFGEQSVEFLNVVTSAPSTIMAISAMMTSLPSYLIARNYDDFMFDNKFYTCLNDIVKKNGYFSMGFFRHMHPREKFQNLFDFVPHKYWEPYLRHGKIWSNTDLWKVLKNFLRDEIHQPAFLFIHFNCRKDPKTSDIVEGALGDLQTAGFTADNTIYVLCSDHGYPDSSRGLTPDSIRRSRLSHDLILTDDNIKIPLYIKYPRCEPKKIHTTISSLDITPTILDLAGISLGSKASEQFQGVSLKDLINGECEKRPGSEYVRSDARLMFQTGRVTAIRNDSYKYLRSHDPEVENNEELYDLVEDPLEGRNIADSDSPAVKQALLRFRQEFNRHEQEVFRHQVNYMLMQFRKQKPNRLGQRNLERDPRLILITVEPKAASYASLAAEVINEMWPNSGIDLLLHEDDFVSGNFLSDRYNYTLDNTSGEFKITTPPDVEYDLQYVLTINPANPISKKVLQLSKFVRTKITTVVDCNMNAYRRHQFWYYRLRAFVSRLKYVWLEPATLLGLFWDTYKVVLKKAKKRM